MAGEMTPKARGKVGQLIGFFGSTVVNWSSVVNVSANVTLAYGAIHLVNTTSARTLTFPVPLNQAMITIKDISFQSQTNNITLAQHASENIEGSATSMILASNGGYWTFISNGTDWFRVG